MNTPSVAEQLRAMGNALPHPQKQERAGPTPIKRTPFGEGKTKERDQKERRFQSRVEAKARRLGWYPWHCHDPQRSGAGFPDLALFKDRIVWAELKVYYDNGRANRLSGVQERFHDMLRAAGGEVYVWYDDDDGWAEIVRVLSDGRLSLAETTPHTSKGTWR